VSRLSEGQIIAACRSILTREALRVSLVLVSHHDVTMTTAVDRQQLSCATVTVTAHNFASDVDVSSNAKLRAERHGRKLNVHNAFHYSAPGGTAAYCAERVCPSVCLFARVSPELHFTAVSLCVGQLLVHFVPCRLL